MTVHVVAVLVVMDVDLVEEEVVEQFLLVRLGSFVEAVAASSELDR
ncbi:hypothetical protein QP027_04745 [Corynebacterium breve]|uniref:Uncharacterized protein n=1 Tax=Corynebacterium breve TaxID=3049799 RepID=A0ABY8VGR3_9CORY|nr:hypothetical protein [Corynebacterium breve]WIM68698.1 hypothetical protein QP027_04745 [Corynebacterium breve]